jgi:hypothetical protein
MSIRTDKPAGNTLSGIFDLTFAPSKIVNCSYFPGVTTGLTMSDSFIECNGFAAFAQKALSCQRPNFKIIFVTSTATTLSILNYLY